MDTEIVRKKVQELLEKEDMSTNEKKILIKLYLLCSKLDKYFSITKKNKKDTLKAMENEIYNIDNKVLTDAEKVYLEYIYYKNLNKPILNDYIKYIERKIVDNKNNLSEQELEYLKELLVKIQILTNNDITFFNSSYELLDKYVDDDEIKRVK